MTNILEMVDEIDAQLSADIVEANHHEGKEGYFIDFDIASPDTQETARTVFVRLVKNGSGGTLLPGVVLKPTTTSAKLFRTSVAGAAGATDKPVGVVNRHISSSGVADTKYFWMVVEGPTEVIDSGSGVTAGDTIKTATGGDVAKNTSTPVEFDLGTALETAAANATFLACVNCRGNA